jgi:alpha-1,3-rhamnosyl/mannosyltransferase
MPSTLKRALYRQCISRAVRLADCVIVPSRATFTDLSRLYPKVSDRVVVTPYAADDFSAAPPKTLTNGPAGKTSMPYLLTMGNTRPHKDLPTLLRAFGALAPSLPDLHLLLAGTEPPGYLLSQLASVPSDVSNRVFFTGPVGDEELRVLYAGATVFVCPSLHEGFGFPVLEAMALGTPVVCADSSSLPEVAGDAALLFPPGDQDRLVTTLARVLGDPGLRQDLIAAGRERAACFSWASTAAATVAVYAAVLLGRDTLPSRSEGKR